MLQVKLIREVKYPRWVSNCVVVKKRNTKNRICVDYTDLNKACPKDQFPLPHSDIIVNATIGHRMLSFIDVFPRDNQIRMNLEDEDRMTFHTSKNIYCYIVMPFGLRMWAPFTKG